MNPTKNVRAVGGARKEQKQKVNPIYSLLYCSYHLMNGNKKENVEQTYRSSEYTAR